MSIPELLSAPSGLHRLPAGPLDELEAVALAAGLISARVDLSGCARLDEALEVLAAALQFPDWFGHNLDALMDCLTDLSWLPAPGYLLLLSGTETPAAADPQGLSALLEVLADASRVWADDGVPFWVLADVPDLAELPGNAA